MTPRRWFFAAVLAIWIAALLTWVVLSLDDTPREGLGSSVLGMALVLPPLALAYEGLTILQAWLRSRWRREDGDA